MRPLVPALFCAFVLAGSTASYGQLFDWARPGGGIGLDRGANGVAHDSTGNVYITGEFSGSAVFGQGQPGETTLISSGAGDAFLAKYDQDGNLQWARRAGGFDQDAGNAIAVDFSDDIYVVGRFRFEMTFHDGLMLPGDGAGGVSSFVAKYRDDGSLDWAVKADNSITNGVAAAADGVYITGQMVNFTDFGSGVSLTGTVIGIADPFIAKYAFGGNALWARQGAGTSGGIGVSVASGASGAVITGVFAGEVVFGSGEPTETTLTGVAGQDIFLARFDADGDLAWAKEITGIGGNQGLGVAIDAAGNSYLTGEFTDSAQFGAGEPNATILNSAAGVDAFLAKFDPAGALAWVKPGSGNGNDHGRGVSLTASGVVGVAGSFGSGALVLGAGEPNETTLTTTAAQQAFLAQYSSDGILLWARQATGSQAQALAVSIDDQRAATYISGNFTGSTIFGAGEPNEATLASAGGSDVFVAKYVVDVLGPVTSNVVANPNPAASGGTALLTALVDDSTTGGSNIASANYTVDGSAPTAMQPADGSFNSPTEGASALLPALPVGLHEVCVGGVDRAGNAGEYSCIDYIVQGSDLVITKTSQINPITIRLSNTAVVQSNQVDPQPADNTATDISDIAVRTSVTYIITVTNKGPSAAGNVVVDDELPREARLLSFVPSQGSCRTRGRRLTCTLGTLVSGGIATVMVATEVD